MKVDGKVEAQLHSLLLGGGYWSASCFRRFVLTQNTSVYVETAAGRAPVQLWKRRKKRKFVIFAGNVTLPSIVEQVDQLYSEWAEYVSEQVLAQRGSRDSCGLGISMLLLAQAVASLRLAWRKNTWLLLKLPSKVQIPELV
jgi:hypothetical protein